MTTNPKWKMIFYVANGEITSESDVSDVEGGLWLKAKATCDGVNCGGDTVWYVDSDDLEVGDVPSAS